MGNHYQRPSLEHANPFGFECWRFVGIQTGRGMVMVDHNGFIADHESAIAIIEQLQAGYNSVTKEEVDKQHELVNAAMSDRMRVARDEQRGNSKAGIVYLLRHNDLYKIGRTRRTIEERVKEMSTGNAEPIDVVMWQRVGDAAAVESGLHRKFESLRVRGEWFKLRYLEIAEVHMALQDAAV